VLVAGLLLIEDPSGFLWIRFAVAILAAIVGVFAVQARQWWWLVGLVPIAVLLLEPWGARLRVAPFVVIGAIVSGFLARVVLTQPVGVLAHPHALEYRTEVQNPYVWAVFYVIAVIAPALLSGYPSIVVFGMANLVGLAVVAVVYFQAFASLWCLYAAMTSVLVLVHMIRRRRLPDPHRQDGMSPSVTVPV
jgi:hypothetical protein